jgi:hypothetical protein
MTGKEKNKMSPWHLVIAVLIFSVLTASIFWRYFEGMYLAGSDAMGPFADLEMMRVENSYFSSWRDVTALGYLNFPSPTLSLFFYLSTGVMNADVVMLWKLMLIAAFWLAGILMFFCAYRITGSYLGAVIAGLVYALNQVFLSQVTEVHHYFILGYAMFPMLFLLIFRTIEGDLKKSLLVLPFLAIVYGTISSPHTVLITGVFLLLFIGAYTTFIGRRARKERRYLLVLGAVVVLIVVLPMAIMKYSGGGNSTLDTHYSIEEAGAYSSYSIFHSLILASSENTFIQGTTGGEWTYPPELMAVGLAIALVIPSIAFLSLKVQLWRPLILSLILPSLLFIFLAKGPNPPLGELFTYAFSNIPLMDSLRVYSRLHLLTGFAYALLVAIVLANIDDVRSLIPDLRGWVQKVARILFDKRVLVPLIVLAMVLPSSAVFLADEPRSFDLPDEYAEPYQWLKGQEGNFRVLNLPYQQVYYTSEGEDVNGYPNTMTLDVGMYSTLISNKPYAYGVETQDYWTFLGSTLKERRFGYQQLGQILGGVASVRYVVSQVQTSAEEESLFSSLEGLSLKESFSGGSTIYENSQWTSQLHAVDRMCLFVGNRADIPTALGLRIINLTSDAILLIDQVGSVEQFEAFLDKMDIVILTDGNLLRLAASLSWPEGATINLAEVANTHTSNTEEAWVQSTVNYSSGVASGLTADTSGANRLDVSTNLNIDDEYDLLLSLVEGPEAGQLDISVDGQNVTSLLPSSTYLHQQWVRISGLNLTKGQHFVTIENDGRGNSSLGQLILVPHQDVDDRLELLSKILDKHTNKLVSIVGANSHLWSDGTFFPWTGPKGEGVASMMQLAATDFAGYEQVVDQNAYGGLAVEVGARERIDSPIVRDLKGGLNYTVSLSVNNPGKTSTSSQMEIWAGSNNTLSLVQVNSIMIPSGSAYWDQDINFTLPHESDRMEVRIYAGENGLRVDRLAMWPQVEVSPEVGIDITHTGEYVLRVAGGDGSITIDGALIPYSSYADGIYLYNSSLLTSGHHIIGLGGEGVYALYYYHEAYTQDSSVSTLAFQRVSNVEFTINITSDGPTWFVLSESYHPLWSAVMEGTVLEHIQADSMINAFYIPGGGNHTITVRFLGQDTYNSILISLLVLLVVSTAMFATALWTRTRPWTLRPHK